MTSSLTDAVFNGLQQALSPFLSLLIVALLIKIFLVKLEKRSSSYKSKKESNVIPLYNSDPAVSTREYKFRRRFIMTNPEKVFFLQLIQAIPEFYVFPQVSFLALLDPVGQASLGKIQNKRVDFVVFDMQTNRYCIIELDDKSHQRKQNSDFERDVFFNSAGIRSLRYKTNNPPSVEALREDILAIFT